MLEFYKLSESLRVTASVLAITAVILLSAGAFYCAVRRRDDQRRLRALEALLLGVMTFHAILLVYLIAQIQLGAGDGFIARAGARGLRCVSFAAIALLAALVSRKRGAASPLFALLPALMTLPSAETVFGSLFPVNFFLALIVDIAFSAGVITAAKREIGAGLSAASVKQEIDALHTGIMFCEPSGYILLVNRGMLSLMQALAGQSLRDGNKFYRLLEKGACDKSCKRITLDENIAYRLPNGTVWLFSKTPVAANGREYIQLTACDVTERWRMTEELEARQAALLARSGELKDAIANIQAFCRDEEALRMKSRFHDVLGHRVALLLRALRENKEPDAALLNNFSLELKEDLGGGAAAEAKKRIDTLRLALLGMGVELNVAGPLPGDAELASLAADVVTEGSTNAVRHGFASRVDVSFGYAAGTFSVTVTDNGIPPKGVIREGGGLSGMRRKLNRHGGSLEITAAPRFILTANMPTGDDL